MPGFLIFFFYHYVCSNFTQHKECWLWEPSTHKRSCHFREIPICQAHFSMFSPLIWEFVQWVFIIFTQPSPTPRRFTLSFIQSHCCSFLDLKPWRRSFAAHIVLDVWSSGAWLIKQGIQTENWLSLSITNNSSTGMNRYHVCSFCPCWDFVCVELVKDLHMLSWLYFPTVSGKLSLLGII